MHPSLVRHLLLPLHERLLGRDTFARLEELQRSQWFEPAELRQLQLRKLRCLLAHAQQHCPLYARRLSQAGIDPGRLDSLEQLTAMPPIDKHQLRRYMSQIVWPDAPGGARRASTGGSTGRPLTFLIDRRRQAADRAARARAHRWFGVQPGQRELYLWGAPAEINSQHRLKRLRDRLLNDRLLDAFNMSAQRMDRYLDQIASFNPTCLFGYPSSLALLANHALARGRQLDLPQLLAVFVTGEVLLPQHRRVICTAFAAPVADGYGGRESGFIAHHCPEGTMHITAEDLIVELLDQNDQPVPPGQTGQIVVTHLENYAMPLIRYRTGDLARWAPADCPCGRALPALQAIQGRQTDFIVTPDGTVKHALSLIYALRDLPGVGQFRIHQHRQLDITVQIVAHGSNTATLSRCARQALRAYIGPDLPLTVELVDSIDPAASGKHRYVVSEAALPQGLQMPTGS